MSVACVQFVRMRARYRASDLWLLIQQCGVEALPIVTLISFLVGVILAFVSAVQLKQFGAQIYVADLVGVAMTREMGALMSAILMAGRTGAAFAAELGTMKVTQELDAFTTAGFSILEFLVLPRVLALVLMMPLLCLYADFVGILGGAVIGVGMLDLSWTTYFEQTARAVRLGDIVGGVFKGAVYGGLDRGCRLFARPAVRQQRVRRREGGHLGGRDQHGRHHRSLRRVRLPLLRAGDLRPTSPPPETERRPASPCAISRWRTAASCSCAT